MLIAACPCLFVAVSRRRVLPVSSAAAPRPGKVHVQILLRPSHLAVTMAVIATARPASAEETYPIRPIRLIMPFPPGGPTDVMGRLISQGLSNQLGQQVYVDNRPGAGSTLAAKIAANAEPDAATRSCSAAPRCSPSVRRFITTPNTIRKVCAGRHGCRGALCHGGEPQSADLKL